MSFTNDSSTAPQWIVADDSQVFHVALPARRRFSTGTALCGGCDAFPEGGVYRSGRRRPIVTETIPSGRHLCTKCEAMSELPTSAPATVLQRFVANMRAAVANLPTERLVGTAKQRPDCLQRQIAIRLAQAELRTRGVMVEVAA